MIRRYDDASMRTSTVIGLALLVILAACGQSASLGQEPGTTLATKVSILNPGEAKASCQKDWQSIAEPTDPALLDNFIATYPDSELVREAFSLRYYLVKASRSIDAYNAFLKRYPSKAISPLAVTEVFNLYSEQDSLSAYLDFLKRYPGTPEAQIATLHVYVMAYDLLLSTKSVEACDSFLRRFPNAPQFKTVTMLATDWMLQSEQNQISVVEDKSGKDSAETREKLEKMYQTLMQQAADLELAWPGTEDLRERRILVDCQVLRIYSVANECYGVRLLHAAELNQLINAKVSQIDLEHYMDQVDKNHKELIATLKSEFLKTRDTLRNGFKDVCKNLENLEAQLQVLSDSVDRVHEDISKTNQLLGDIKGELGDVNAKLDTLHDDINKVKDQMSTLITVTSNGFGKLDNDLNQIQQIVTDIRTNQGVQIQLESDIRTNQGVQIQLESQMINTIVQQSQITDGILQDAMQGSRSGWFDTIKNDVEKPLAHAGDVLTQIASNAGKFISPIDHVICRSATLTLDEGKSLQGILRSQFSGKIQDDVIRALDPNTLLPAIHNLRIPDARISPLCERVIANAWAGRRNKVVDVIKMFPNTVLSQATMGMPVRGPEELEKFTQRAASEVGKSVDMIKKACKCF